MISKVISFISLYLIAFITIPRTSHVLLTQHFEKPDIRALYKDFLCLMNQPKIIPNDKLRRKMECTIYGDRLISHHEKTNARTYKEERQINSCNIKASFYFLTIVYDNYVKRVLKKITAEQKPDVLVINSFLWDITRWGSSGVKDYKKNLTLLMEHLQQLLPDCLVIWMTTPPISKDVKGGFLVEELKFLEHALRYHVLEGNCFARQVVVEHGFNVVDCHYHLKLQIHRRADDGIHWKPEAMRYVLNLLLTHISLAWSVPLPRHGRSKESITEIEQLVDEPLEELLPIEEVSGTSKNINNGQSEDSSQFQRSVDKTLQELLPRKAVTGTSRNIENGQSENDSLIQQLVDKPLEGLAKSCNSSIDWSADETTVNQQLDNKSVEELRLTKKKFLAELKAFGEKVDKNTSKTIDKLEEQEPGPSNQGQAKTSQSKACIKPIQAKRFIKKITYP